MSGALVLGIDPGTRKVGYALVGRDDGAVRSLGIAPFAELPELLAELRLQGGIDAVALGDGTNVGQVRAALEGLAPVTLVDERDTTYRARRLYFEDHPPRGWRRFLPLGLQVPPRPIDDYAAVLIARRFIGQGIDPRGRRT